MTERYDDTGNEQPPLTTFEVESLARQAIAQGMVFDVPNLEDQAEGRPLPHYFVLSVDDKRLQEIRQYNDSLPRSTNSQISSVEIQYAEEWAEEGGWHTFKPFVVVSLRSQAHSDVDPSTLFNKTTEYFLPLAVEGEYDYTAFETYYNADGEQLALNTPDDLEQTVRELTYEDLRFLRLLI